MAGDTLAASTAGTSITASYNGSSGVLTLTGSDTLAHYQSVLASVTYSSSVADARGTNGADPSRTIDWSANDGTSLSAVATSTVNIPDIAPVVTAGGAVSYTEQGAAMTLDSGLTVTDIDNTTLSSATVSIAADFLAGDVLSATTTGTSVTQSYNATTGVLTLTGSDTLAHYQNVLNSVTFSSVADARSNGADPSRTIGWSASDGTSLSAVATSTVNIPDTAPVVTAGAAVGYTEQAGAVTLDGALTVGDIDNATLTSATVAISAGLLSGDTLVATTTGTSIAQSYNGTTGVLTLTGSDTLAHYQSVLDSVTYSSSAADPTNAGTDAMRTLSWQATDGTSLSTATTSKVDIVPPASPPYPRRRRLPCCDLAAAAGDQRAGHRRLRRRRSRRRLHGDE